MRDPFIVNELVRKWHNDVVGIILGDGSGKDLREEMVDNFGIKDRVITLGQILRKHYLNVLSMGYIF